MKIADSFKLVCQSGFAFIELLVSLGIVVFAILCASVGSVGMFRQQTAASNSTIAMHLAQDKLEELQALRILTDMDVCPSGGDRGIGANGVAPGIFDRCWRIAASALGTHLKEIGVTVSWRDHQGHQVNLSTLAFRGQ